MKQSELTARAQQILIDNRQVSARSSQRYTIPRAKLYPFQWNWDSGFCALGFNTFNSEFAIEELQTLFSGQWSNGFLPHIIFHSEDEHTYFPNFNVWNANANAHAPTTPKTSGITQPPVHGFVLESLYHANRDNPKIAEEIKVLINQVVALHLYLYTHRDPFQEGLIYINHPWESGRDNSPLWDKILNNLGFDRSAIAPYKRRDTAVTSADQRPTDRDYDTYVYLMELARKTAYDDAQIASTCPFLVQDTLTNAILIRSNESLITLSGLLGVDAGNLRSLNEKSKARFAEKLWNKKLNTFCCYDLHHEQQIELKEVGAQLAMFAGIASDQQAKHLTTYLREVREKGFVLCPSFDPSSEAFDPRRYWRGPVWPPINWMLYHGLARYGEHELANSVRQDLISLIEQYGFFEYFDPRMSEYSSLTHGYGGDYFSWTAACFLDLTTPA